MTKEDVQRALEDDPRMPISRSKLAIPFIGKDVPSPASEFAHPDVTVGLTILAYRYEGLRFVDFSEFLASLQASMTKEMGPVEQRPSVIRFNEFVTAGGGQVCGSYNEVKERSKEEIVIAHAVKVRPGMTYTIDRMGNIRGLPNGTSSTAETLISTLMNLQQEQGFQYKVDGEGNIVRSQIRVLALHLLRRSNESHMQPLFILLQRLPCFVHAYLQEFIFPQFMRHKSSKLSASGQELGGAMLFGRRIGFSGTPSALLPDDLGKCGFADDDEGSILNTLSSSRIVTVEYILEKHWSVEYLLQKIAKSTSPTFNALIDTGALITGMSNLDVARFLSRNGLASRGIEGVVYLDEKDRKMVFVAATNNSVKIEESGIAKERRFAFYDQIHTTGTDIQHIINAKAVLTLGKDMTFRDYAQGAYRMRGIGKGQTIHLFVIPEVTKLIQRELKRCHQSVDGLSDDFAENGAPEPGLSPSSTPIAAKLSGPSSVMAWLFINSMRSERIQFNLLQIQNAANVWRKSAMNSLLDNSSLLCSLNSDEALMRRLKVFEENVNFSIANEVRKPLSVPEILGQLISENKDLVIDEYGHDLLQRLHNGLKDIALEDLRERDQEAEAAQELDQEQEQEKEQEQEQEQEIEIEKFMDLAYSRSEEASTPWPFADLRTANPPMFYQAKDFQLCRRKPLTFPDFISLSKNYFNPKWSGWRRLKNVVCILDVLPGQAMETLGQQHCMPLDEDIVHAAHDILGRIWALFPRNTEDKISIDSLQSLIEASFGIEVTAKGGVTTNSLLNNSSSISYSFPISNANASEKTLIEYMAPLKLAFAGQHWVDRDSVLKALLGPLVRQVHASRYSVLISLSEAETIRRILHLRQDQGGYVIDGHRTAIALRSLPGNWQIIDQSRGYIPAPNFQSNVTHQSLRFFDGELYFTSSQLKWLLAGIEASPQHVRQVFFENVAACRRRAVSKWTESPVARAFQISTEFHLVIFIHKLV